MITKINRNIFLWPNKLIKTYSIFQKIIRVSVKSLSFFHLKIHSRLLTFKINNSNLNLNSILQPKKICWLKEYSLFQKNSCLMIIFRIKRLIMWMQMIYKWNIKKTNCSCNIKKKLKISKHLTQKHSHLKLIR